MQDNFKQKLREQELRLRLKEDLERQIADARLQKERQLVEDERYRRSQEEQRAAWADQERQQKEDKLQIIRADQSDRMAQLMKTAQRKEEECQRDRQHAKALLDTALHEVQFHREQAETRWGKEREEAQLALQISCESQRIKEQNQQRQRDLEEQSIAQYQKLKAQRERQVKERRAEDICRCSQLEGQAADRAAAARRREQEALARSAAQLSEANEQTARREADNQQQLVMKKLETQAYLRAQIKEKHDRKRAEEERLRGHRVVSETDARRFEEEQQQRVERKKAHHMQNRAQLEFQIAKKVVAPSERRDVMSTTEFAMNRALLDGVA